MWNIFLNISCPRDPWLDDVMLAWSDTLAFRSVVGRLLPRVCTRQRSPVFLFDASGGGPVLGVLRC